MIFSSKQIWIVDGWLLILIQIIQQNIQLVQDLIFPMRQTDEKAMMGCFFSKNSPYIEIYFYNIIKPA